MENPSSGVHPSCLRITTDLIPTPLPVLLQRKRTRPQSQLTPYLPQTSFPSPSSRPAHQDSKEWEDWYTSRLAEYELWRSIRQRRRDASRGKPSIRDAVFGDETDQRASERERAQGEFERHAALQLNRYLNRILDTEQEPVQSYAEESPSTQPLFRLFAQSDANSSFEVQIEICCMNTEPEQSPANRMKREQVRQRERGNSEEDGRK